MHLGGERHCESKVSCSRTQLVPRTESPKFVYLESRALVAEIELEFRRRKTENQKKPLCKRNQNPIYPRYKVCYRNAGFKTELNNVSSLSIFLMNHSLYLFQWITCQTRTLLTCQRVAAIRRTMSSTSVWEEHPASSPCSRELHKGVWELLMVSRLQDQTLGRSSPWQGSTGPLQLI